MNLSWEDQLGRATGVPTGESCPPRIVCLHRSLRSVPGAPRVRMSKVSAGFCGMTPWDLRFVHKLWLMDTLEGSEALSVLLVLVGTSLLGGGGREDMMERGCLFSLS